MTLEVALSLAPTTTPEYTDNTDSTIRPRY
jgi:hypothetical protein